MANVADIVAFSDELLQQIPLGRLYPLQAKYGFHPQVMIYLMYHVKNRYGKIAKSHLHDTMKAMDSLLYLQMEWRHLSSLRLHPDSEKVDQQLNKTIFYTLSIHLGHGMARGKSPMSSLKETVGTLNTYFSLFSNRLGKPDYEVIIDALMVVYPDFSKQQIAYLCDHQWDGFRDQMIQRLIAIARQPA